MKDIAQPHELIQSFISGLSDFLATILPSSAASKHTRTLVFTSGTTNAQAWTADGDYYVVGVTANTTSIQVLSTDNSPTTVLASADKIWAGGIIVAQNFSGTVIGMRAFIKTGTKLYWAPAATGEFCNVFLEAA